MNDDEKLASESAGEMQPVLRALDIEENSHEVESDASSRRTRLFVLIGTCGLGFFVADVLTAMFFKEALPALLTLGIVTAQLTVICVWGTLVRGTFWIRLPWTLLLLVVSWFGLGLGASYVDRNFNSNVALGIGMVWMLGFVTSYIPLKIAAIGFRWEIVRESVNNQNQPDTRRYAIRDMMLGTLLLAITLAIGRAMLSSDEINLALALRASGLVRSEPIIALMIYGVVSLLVKLPCIWIALGERQEAIRSRIEIWVVYCLGLSILEVVLFMALLGSPGPDSIEFFTGVILSHQLMGAIMLGVCLMLRGLGYRLKRSVRDSDDQIPNKSPENATANGKP